MKFLIPTEPDDTHAILVKVALENLGHHVRLLFTADQPTKQKNSVYIYDKDYYWSSIDDYNEIVDNEYDVVWWRRARKPFLPKDIAHPKDYKFIVRENILFYESLTDNIAPNAWWVNSKEAAYKINHKLFQLKVARECGMIIPITLCSNNPKDIHCFLLKYKTAGVIYKPMCSNFWFEENNIKISYTSKVTISDLPNDKLLSLSPGIFQKEIKKKYELRVTCFGEFIIAVRLNSQSHKEGIVDWRAIPEGQMKIDPYILPIDLEKKIRVFMKKTGIVFGAFDFIVTPDDEIIFLEVNEQGQFLWIEEYNPSIKMLDIFINFLINKSINYQWNPKKLMHTIVEYKDYIDEIMAQNIQRHVNLNNA